MFWAQGYFDNIIWQSTTEIDFDGSSPLKDDYVESNVEFEIPPKLSPSESESDNPTYGHFWKLDLKLKRRGLNYVASFTIPMAGNSEHK